MIWRISPKDFKRVNPSQICGRTPRPIWPKCGKRWLGSRPGQFPNGVHVIYTNLYEFTDATGDTSACPAAGLAGYGDAVTDPALEEMVVWSLEQYMDIAVQTQSDMLFLLESFCGHGYRRDDASGRCYRGPDAELWFDLTCTHPNPAGHRVIADMMMDVVLE